MCCCWGVRGSANLAFKLLYYFLVERVVCQIFLFHDRHMLTNSKYVVRRSTKPRMRDPMYLFNSFGMLRTFTGPFIVK